MDDEGGQGLCVFFQAEDGIRDIGVTGVQTCALPIWNLWNLQFLNRKTLELHISK